MNLIAKKLCNALIKTAEPSSALKFLAEGVNAAIPFETNLGIAKRATGGTWVGGNIFLYDDVMLFKPNSLNKLAHNSDASWRIPLEEVINVKTEFGFFTRIINVTTKEVTFRFRCYGANKFAEKITVRVNSVKH